MVAHVSDTMPQSRTGGVDLAEWLVRSGLALDWPQYSKSAYAAAQLEAERANLGMWAAASKNLGAIALADEQAVGCSDQP
jgi:endonuclease YncB( thermonuclease family)